MPAGSKSWAIPLKGILGVDLPGAHGDRRTFDIICYDHQGKLLAELQQLEASHLAAFEAYMVRSALKAVRGFVTQNASADPDTYVI